MSKSRKQIVLEQVQRQRRQRNILTLVIAVVIIAVIVVAVVALPRPPPNPVGLPDYLSHCVVGRPPPDTPLVYHSHPNLTIIINGIFQPLPTTFSSSCQQPIHTHSDSQSVLHIETDQDRDYKLGDWFLLWGYWASNTRYSIFNSTQIFDNKAGPGTMHTLSLTVNGQQSTQFQDLVFPRNAVTGAASCQTPPCAPFNIVITYS